MSLRFLGGNTGGGGSPRLYREGDDYLVQGYAVTAPEVLAELNIPGGEAVVRVPRSLWQYLPAGARTSQRPERSGERELADCGHETCEREMRDWYASEEAEHEHGRPATWRAGTFGLAEDSAARRCWLDLVKAEPYREAAADGAWPVPGPVSGLARFEGAGGSRDSALGGRVRWLLRRRSRNAMADDPARECLSAFDAVWALSAPTGRPEPD